MAREGIDRRRLRGTLRGLGKDKLVALLEGAFAALPAAQIRTVFGRHLDLDRLASGTASKAGDTPQGLLKDVRKFHARSVSGDYYEPFAVNSRNFMETSEGTEAWSEECRRLLERCAAASGKGYHSQARECFDLLLDLLARIDRGEDVVFFADEGGSWQVADLDPILPSYFSSLAALAEPQEYAARVGELLHEHGAHPARSMRAARRPANAAQRRMLRTLGAPKR